VALSRIEVGTSRTTVQLGATRFEQVETGTYERPIFAGEAGLLGNGLLSRFGSVTVDERRGRVILGSNKSEIRNKFKSGEKGEMTKTGGGGKG
jgi:hypothetical protein